MCQRFCPARPFVCPLDGKNPNRFFPGDPQGTFTDVMDDAIFRTVIAPSDALIDLHGGDMVESLALFAMYATAVTTTWTLARSLWAGHSACPTSSHRDLNLAASQARRCRPPPRSGFPGVIAEAGSSGLLTEPETRTLVDGIGNTLRALDMLDGEVKAFQPVEIGRFTWMRVTGRGDVVPSVQVGEQVREGQNIGRIGNLFGDTLEEITAPHDGVVIFTTSAPAMPRDGLIIAVGGS